MMDQQSTKSERDLMKKNFTIQSTAIEIYTYYDLLYQKYQQHLDHSRTPLLKEDRRRSVDNESKKRN